MSNQVEQEFAIVNSAFALREYNRQRKFDEPKKTQATEAKVLGINQQIFTNIANGKTPQILVYFAKLLKSKNVSFSDLIEIERKKPKGALYCKDVPQILQIVAHLMAISGCDFDQIVTLKTE